MIFPLTQSYTVIKNQKIAQFSTSCFTNATSSDNHVITCENIDVNSVTAMVEEEVEVNF